MPPWPPRPAPALGFPRLLAGPRLWSHFLGNPGFFSREGPAQCWARETDCMAPATRRPQPQHGQESPGNSCSQVDREKRVPLDKRTRGTETGQRRDGPAAGSPRVEGFLSPGIPGSWHKTTPYTGHIQDTPMMVEKGRCPSWNNRVGRF